MLDKAKNKIFTIPDFSLTYNEMPGNNHNKLFLVCPLCRLERFISSHYENAFFMTAPAGIFRFEADESQIIHDFIKREKITDVYFVGETSCNFINLVMKVGGYSGRFCEFEIGKLKTCSDTIETLTEKLLRYEAFKMKSVEIFRNDLLSGKYNLHLLIANKHKNEIREILPE
ncbi:hypothetical protein SAMN05192529_11520 [Arachidicoccus rhizosphaerae]|uniref:Carbonic anhydrase n=1 Tax=Arachidicoccus rhizosphaerae TaxID=551991 RepID=A0A1H4AJ83_9BACT|nr:hypothetical protein [Arachidicoccus rhizosphaerae]SEA35955.1 hypothetical protein SAMN05192529_11520 [Arachidicoccus rhizosphaerae]